jgi:hypothetical protein
MNLSRLFDALHALPSNAQQDWAIAAAVVLALVVLVLWLEWRHFRRQHKASSWLALRLVSVLAAPLAVLAVMVPTRAVSGMEGLAMFYGTLFTVAPLIWFGAHAGVGRLLALSTGECLALSLTGLLLFGLPGVAVFQALGPLEAAARLQEDRVPAAAVPLAHAVQPLQRFNMPVVGTVFAQSLIAPPGLRLERVDERVGELWQDSAGISQTRFCRQGEDLHLMWAAREPAPWLRLHWVDADGQRHAAPHRPMPGEGEVSDFVMGFRSDGFDVAAPVPRPRVHFALARQASGQWNHIALGNAMQDGERARDSCLMPGYRRLRWETEGPVLSVLLMFQRPGEPAWRAEFTRPVAP